MVGDHADGTAPQPRERRDHRPAVAAAQFLNAVLVGEARNHPAHVIGASRILRHQAAQQRLVRRFARGLCRTEIAEVALGLLDGFGLVLDQDVDRVNEMCQARRIARGELGPDALPAPDRDYELHEGDRVMLRERAYTLDDPAERRVEGHAIRVATLAARIAEVSGLDRVFFCNSGTEATMSALRLARGFTGRDLTIKFEGCYHGHVDSLLVKAGSGMATLGIADAAGVPKAFAETTIVLPYNDRAALDAWAADPLGYAGHGAESAARLLARVAADEAQLELALGRQWAERLVSAAAEGR